MVQATTATSLRATLGTFIECTKPRVILLLLITGYFGMWVANGSLPDLKLTFWTMLGLYLSCGGANAVNMWFDSDIDSVMKRTIKRPIPSGRLSRQTVLVFGISLGIISFLLLWVAANLLTAVLAQAGYLFYVFIYTMWLKRSTTQNIVIGGVAGAVPPLVGWAAVTGTLSPAAWIMFLIIFMWTPPHFWALALYRNEDYTRAQVPMLPVIHGEAVTKRQILLYAVLLIPTTALLWLTGRVGYWYLGLSTVIGLVYLYSCIALFREKMPEQKWAKKSFKWSLYYLALIFAVMAFDIVG
ncbi:MAG TPA: heme o synthase [Symbiobacteriaceae bacterium]|nr:heme o synthase [Symbiobacteriaceae bacterium]